jgi:hypothetical protein
LAICKIRSTEHHEINELRYTGVVRTWVVIGRDNKVSQPVHELEFVLGEELRLKNGGMRSDMAPRDFMTASKPPALESRKNTGRRDQADYANDIPALKSLAAHRRPPEMECSDNRNERIGYD